MKHLRSEHGQTLIMVAFCLPLLLGFLALAVDVGVLFQAKRQLQTAADAAVLAAALDYKFNGSVSSAQQAGLTAASANYVTNGVNGTTVTIDIPPVNGPFAGSSGHLEAVVTQPHPTFFMRLFGTNSVTIVARAVSGAGAGDGCVWALAKVGDDFSITGSGTISVPGCDIFDNSDSSNALTLTGSGSLTAKAIAIVGNYTRTGSGSISPTPVTGTAPVADPLSNLVFPTVNTSGCSAAQNFTGSTAHQLEPGCYDGISNTGSGSLTLTSGNYTINGSFTSTGSGAVNLGAGQYIVTGNLSLTGSGALTGSGVTFYTEGTTSVTGSSALNLSAPTSGPDSGLLFFQSRSDTNAISITGSSNMNLQGIIYAPDSPLTFTGSGSTNIYTDLVVDSVSFTGSTPFQNYAAINSSSVLGGKIGLQE